VALNAVDEAICRLNNHFTTMVPNIVLMSFMILILFSDWCVT